MERRKSALISQSLLTQDTATQRLSLCFLVEAERDIASCNALYSKKLYPHAVYHLQQAVEKATKGYMLGFNWLSAQELRKIGHDTPKLILDALFKETGIESWFKQGGDEVLETIINDMWQVMSNPNKCARRTRNFSLQNTLGCSSLRPGGTGFDERDDWHLRPIAFKLTKARRHSFVGYFHWLKWLGWVGSIGENSLAAKGKTTDEGDYGAIDGKGTPAC
ncbi:HEPN domain-containing protein [Dehalococcoidia bacterium]|nr:HEPN domain-containing protein [Dehalococcoidia bacterium]